ncbi:MAG: hypothetical protein Q4D41_06045 [Prevotellaceae bacterium]|nr:hypothetical protein [Prevotellaceae bacterium]
MKLHIFNPEHDMALAYDKDYLTLPHNIQELRTNLGFLPALWADDGDCVLVDDIAYATKALVQTGLPHNDVLFINEGELQKIYIADVEPWGWDKVVRKRLAEAGIRDNILPSEERLAAMRLLSSRMHNSEVLAFVRNGIEAQTCGRCECASSIGNIESYMQRYGKIVVKAPWSSSGRGIRYVSGNITTSLKGWIQNIIATQGYVTMEPYYNKVLDFAMEFRISGKYKVDYCGLSLFKTDKGNYTGNVIATEEEKTRMLSKYVDEPLLTIVRKRLADYFSRKFMGIYEGYFGVDLMAVARDDGDGYLLHPCVEVNLRRTMGHAANSIKASDSQPVRMMRIVHDVNYRLKFDKLDVEYVKTI